MNKKNINKIFSWILLIGWMTIIFIMSNEPAKISDEHSNLVLQIVKTLGIPIDSFFGEIAEFIVRKTAHFTEYMILFFLAYKLLRIYLDIKDTCVFGIIIVIGYACTDEIHQLFVPGRSGMIRDVLIDTSGGIFGLFIILLIKYIKKIKARIN
ncbi:VanZ like family protein [Clostridium cavendishii DSM 21758]|uniref:VanZ like family protein n=1 Tax=Clostridium cavendishii DSM 21758 TaxID=1121302 RepID=A0A1M6VGM7_9CLOT|nr:VanZ family protein [Clostridium cavendishii]SHK80652.1 VanZ like family protein [Clostridium cavendishii DSM 21758]